MVSLDIACSTNARTTTTQNENRIPSQVQTIGLQIKIASSTNKRKLSQIASCSAGSNSLVVAVFKAIKACR